MSDAITVEFRAEALLARLAGTQDRLYDRLRTVMNRLAIGSQGYVKESKLTGQVLHVRTGTLRRSITQRVEETPGAIHATVGTNVIYGRIHEFGFAGAINVREHARRGGTVRAHTRQVNLPERSFLRSSLRDQEGLIRDSLRAAVLQAVRP